jgi:8-oxo-dGTP diphosphatase
VVLTIELFSHMDAGDRTKWTDPQDTRPLSDLGRAQAERLCNTLARAPIDALYSSAALRCRQSIEPLARAFRLPVTVLPGLHETDGWLPPVAWRDAFVSAEAIGGAFAAGAAMRSLQAIRGANASGRVAACTHGDVLPVLVLYLAGAHDLDLPGPNPTRGGWYTLVFDGEQVGVHHHDVLPEFPLPAPP